MTSHNIPYGCRHFLFIEKCQRESVLGMFVTVIILCGRLQETPTILKGCCLVIPRTKPKPQQNTTFFRRIMHAHLSMCFVRYIFRLHKLDSRVRENHPIMKAYNLKLNDAEVS